MPTSTLHSHLVLAEIHCQARIGWSEWERAVTQGVVVGIALDFPVPPAATANDQLADTVDYAALTPAVVSVCAARPYALLERLAHVLYDVLREALPADVRVFLEVSKLRSPLVELEHSARFGLGDGCGGRVLTSIRTNSARERLVLLRGARDADRADLRRLVELSVWGLASHAYSAQQLTAALSTAALGVDSALIEDGTYFVIEHDAKLVAAGGWSRRDKRFGADAWAEGGARLLDPTRESARIRAFFVHPAWSRRGLARALLAQCESSAAAEGFNSAELTATLSGEPFYRSHGYEALPRITYALTPAVTIQFVPMRKLLKPSGGSASATSTTT